MSKMNKIVLRNAGAALVAVFLIGAVIVIRRDLGAYHLADIIRSLREVPLENVYLALGLTALSYLLLAGYDILALRFIGSTLPYSKIAVNSFIGYAFSYNLGFVAGNAMRSRLYALWGVPAQAIGKALAFLFLTFWLGFFATAGVVFAWAAMPLPPILGFLAFNSSRSLGVLLLGITACYFMWISLRKRTITIGEFEWRFPGIHLSALQVTLASLDWIIASSVLFTLLPIHGEVTFPSFVIIYLFAQLAVVITHVPGGVGIIESTVLLMLPQELSPAALLASLIVYRVVYFIIPFCIACLLFVAEEVFARRALLRTGISLFRRTFAGVTTSIQGDENTLPE